MPRPSGGTDRSDAYTGDKDFKKKHMTNSTTVMPNPKGNAVNVIPTADNVDYDKVYSYDNAASVEQFNFLEFNRNTNDKNVAKILKQIKDGEYGSQFIPPIIVDFRTKAIIDGQNRYIAFLRAWDEGVDAVMRVIYVNVDEEYMDELIKVLQEGRKWNNVDYFHRAIANGNTACKKIEEWCEKHRELCYDNSGPNRSYAMAFIYGRRVDKEVKDLSLKVTKEQIEFSEQIYKEVLGMFKAMKYKRANFIEGMTQSWYGLRKKDTTINNLIGDIGMDFIYDNIYCEMENYQPTTKKSDWDAKFSQIIMNLVHKYHVNKVAA